MSIWYLSLQWGKQIFLVPWLISWFSLWHVPIYQVCGGLKCDNNIIIKISSSWKDPGSTTKFLKISVPFNLANSSTLLPWNWCPNCFHLLVALRLEQLTELRMSISVESSGPWTSSIWDFFFKCRCRGSTLDLLNRDLCSVLGVLGNSNDVISFYSWLHWVLAEACVLSLVAATRGCRLLQGTGFSTRWRLCLRSTGLQGTWVSVVAARGLAAPQQSSQTRGWTVSPAGRGFTGRWVLNRESAEEVLCYHKPSRWFWCRFELNKLGLVLRRSPSVLKRDLLIPPISHLSYFDPLKIKSFFFFFFLAIAFLCLPKDNRRFLGHEGCFSIITLKGNVHGILSHHSTLCSFCPSVCQEDIHHSDDGPMCFH